jgi:hypothetical protein
MTRKRNQWPQPILALLWTNFILSSRKNSRPRKNSLPSPSATQSLLYPSPPSAKPSATADPPSSTISFNSCLEPNGMNSSIGLRVQTTNPEECCSRASPRKRLLRKSGIPGLRTPIRCCINWSSILLTTDFQLLTKLSASLSLHYEVFTVTDIPSRKVKLLRCCDLLFPLVI